MKKNSAATNAAGAETGAGTHLSEFSESVAEEAALAWLESMGSRTAHGPDIAPDMPAAEP